MQTERRNNIPQIGDMGDAAVVSAWKEGAALRGVAAYEW